MQLQEIFELYKKGSITKGSLVLINGSSKQQKIREIYNINSEEFVFSFLLYNSDAIYQSADIEEFISEPFLENDFIKKTKNNVVPILLTEPINLSNRMDTYIGIDPKVLNYLNNRINNKPSKCVIVEECINLLKNFQECQDKNNIADVVIKLSGKLNQLI